MFSFLPLIFFLLIPNSSYAALADKPWSDVFRALSTWHKTSFLSAESSSWTCCVYANTRRCCFLAVYFTTVRIKFTLPCYFSVTSYHETFLNSLLMTCIFAALKYLVSSVYFIIYCFSSYFMNTVPVYIAVWLPSTVKTGSMVFCFLCFTSLLLRIRIYLFGYKTSSKIFWICKWTVSVRSPFSICSPSDDLQKRWCVTSFLKSFVDSVITSNFPCINQLLSFIVASNSSDVEIRQIISSSLDHHPSTTIFK